jgi:tRNA (guanine37-N1)-methyltransferase
VKKFYIITLFGDLFPGPLGVSIFGKSLGSLWDIQIINLRDFGVGKNKIVDDVPFSGGAGMLIRPDVVESAVRSVDFTGRKIFLSPRGKTLKQEKVESLAQTNEDIMILCGRYEGVDQRVIDHLDFEEISIGNYIIAGGESAAFVLMEAIIRKIPGVIGNVDSFAQETFVNNEISEPRFTRPSSWIAADGSVLEVDSLLKSGNHAKIKNYKLSQRKKINNIDDSL